MTLLALLPRLVTTAIAVWGATSAVQAAGTEAIGLVRDVRTVRAARRIHLAAAEAQARVQHQTNGSYGHKVVELEDDAPDEVEVAGLDE